ncbi:MAG: haloacid dehalogenase-like hydrolase [Acidobacteria bacterium]|nr:haloacid dehalogenase-like hydrolase [Acidobacteriota bacterium]
MRLALFDIDGTLITDDGAARTAFGDALVAVYGYDGDLARYDFSGRTDPQIAYMILRDTGLSDEAIAAKLDAMWDHYLTGLARNATADRVRVLPGMRELLAVLAKRDDVTIALLTGNLERGARLKLGPTGLSPYFPFGAFGSDSMHREELPPIAVARANAANGQHFHGRDVVILGDSIYDVRCGVPHGATTIAIASGKTSAERLQAENPSHFFTDARDTEGLVSAILGS